jgi:hypothetical protein
MQMWVAFNWIFWRSEKERVELVAKFLWEISIGMFNNCITFSFVTDDSAAHKTVCHNFSLVLCHVFDFDNEN